MRPADPVICWSILAGAILSEVTASLCLKAALDHPALYAAVVTGYVASFVGLTLVLRLGMALGVAYGIWSALGVALTAVMSHVVYDEAFTGLMGIGLVLIVAGVLAVEVGAQRAARPGPDAVG